MGGWMRGVGLFLGLLLNGSAAAAELPDLVLISLDTTRADALSCMGPPPDLGRDPGPVTPTLDALAAEGLRFESFYTHAPTTLNAHSSMMSGRDPHGHAVPRNGFPLPESLPTLAQRLQREGYDTLAVVGAKALEAKMGLDRGFRVYDDETPQRHGLMYQRRADAVVERALELVAGRRAERPLFLFVHLYDPHGPYEAPQPFGERFVDPDYAGPRGSGRPVLAPVKRALRRGEPAAEAVAYLAARYLGEVAYADHHVGLLLEGLRGEGLLDRALVVVTADHGEVLSEIPEFAYSHGSDVSEGSMHIPLILWGQGVPLRRGVVQRQAELAGLAPTIERLLGLEPSLGQDFWQLVRPGPVLDADGWPERPTRTVFMEATRPRQRESVSAWNNLPFARGVRAGGLVLRAAPVYDVPPALPDASALAPVLAGMLARWDLEAPPPRVEQLSADTRRALEALGYLEPVAPAVRP